MVKNCVHRLAFILIFLATLCSSIAQTNYFCVICGKGPLAGRIWIHPRGAICDECYQKYKDRCSICSLPVGPGYAKTADGRFICKFDKPNTVFTADDAKEVFTETRREIVGLFGQNFALQFPDVAVNVFDVDYWSEKGGTNDLHKFGFAHTARAADGRCTHEVILLSGRLREEIAAIAAHEYTHLWINENCPATHVIEGDTVEAICELTAYKLMEGKKLPAEQQRILENPYTRGKIKTLVALEQVEGIGPILMWVKNGVTTSLENRPAPAPAVVARPVRVNVIAPKKVPAGLTFGGLMVINRDRTAVINGISFAVGDQKRVKLRNKTVTVICREIHDTDLVVDVDEQPLKLFRDEEKLPP